MRSRRQQIALWAAFVVLHAATAWFADHPQRYLPSSRGVTGDVGVYEAWARILLERDVAAYNGIGIEYPPASLPFFALPSLSPLPYRSAFVLLMLAVDVLGFVGLLTLARRWGSSAGPWLWVAFVPLLGPVAFARFDLVPAVAAVWAVVATMAGRDFGAGAWLGFGAAAKLWPGLLLPHAVALARRRRDVVAGAALLLLAAVLPFALHLPDVFTSVITYHSARGIQIESTWATPVLIAARLGEPAFLVFEYGAAHVRNDWTQAFKLASAALSLAAVGAGTWLAWRHVPPPAAPDGASRRAQALAITGFATLALLLVTGSVLSPQFLLWLGAFGAAATCVPDRRLQRVALVLLPAALLTQLVFPVTYSGLLGAEPLPVALLLLRNLLLIGVAVGAVQAALRRPAGRDPLVSVETPSLHGSPPTHVAS